MNILAIETTGNTCGVCLSSKLETGGMQLLATYEVFGSNVHDKLLAQMCSNLLHSSGVGIDDIDVVACSAGPGSFTGLRIGISFAKGLTFSGSPKLLLVDTLASLAQASREVCSVAGKEFCTAVIPSHRDLFYAKRFHFVDNEASEVTGADQHLLTKEQTRLLAESSVVVGPGAEAAGCSVISGLARLSPRFVALRATTLIANKTASYADPLTAEPLYYQSFQGTKP